MFKYILFLILSIIICNCIYLVNKRNHGVGILSGALFSFLAYYCVVPILVLLNYPKIDNKTGFINTIYESSLGEYALFFFCILILIGSIITSYNKATSKKYIYTINNSTTEKYARLLFYFSFIVGITSFTIYVKALGGLTRAIVLAEYMRSFSNSAEDLIPYSAALMQLPSSLVTVCPLFYALIVGNKKWSLTNKIVFIALILVNVPYLLINAGKTGIFLFLLSIWLVLISYKVKHEWILTIILCICGISIINVLDMIFISFRNETNMLQGNIETDWSLLHQFAYPISNALNMHDILRTDSLRLFKDLVTGVLTHFPGLNFEVSYVPTSAFYGGTYWRESGGVPNDILTFSYLQLGPIGVLIIGLIWGYLLGWLENYINAEGDSFSSRFIKYTLILNVFNVVMNADVAAIVVNFKFSLLVFFIYKSLYRIKRNVAAR